MVTRVSDALEATAQLVSKLADMINQPLKDLHLRRLTPTMFYSSNTGRGNDSQLNCSSLHKSIWTVQSILGVIRISLRALRSRSKTQPLFANLPQMSNLHISLIDRVKWNWNSRNRTSILEALTLVIRRKRKTSNTGRCLMQGLYPRKTSSRCTMWLSKSIPQCLLPRTDTYSSNRHPQTINKTRTTF